MCKIGILTKIYLDRLFQRLSSFCANEMKEKKYTSSESIYLQWTDSFLTRIMTEWAKPWPLEKRLHLRYVVCSSVYLVTLSKETTRECFGRGTIEETTSLISFHYFFSRGETPPGQEEEEKRQQNGGARRNTATLLDDNYNRGTLYQSNHCQAHHISSPFSYILWPSWHHDNTAITVFNATTTGQLRLHWYDQISYSREYSEFNSTSFEKR